MDTQEKVFAALGGIGLVIGIVALVIAIGAKNDTTSQSELSDEAQATLEAKATELKGELESEAEKQAKATGAAGNEARKAKKKAKSAGKSISALTTKVDDLTKKVDDLAARTKKLEDDEQAQSQEIATLKGDIKALKKGKANKKG